MRAAARSYEPERSSHQPKTRLASTSTANTGPTHQGSGFGWSCEAASSAAVSAGPRNHQMRNTCRIATPLTLSVTPRL